MARFIKSFLLTCLMLALCFGLPSYAQTTEQWRVTHDSSVVAPPNLYPYKDIGQQIGLDAGGNVYVVETTRPWAYGQPYTPPLEHTIFKYDTYGNKQWARGGFAGHEVKDFHVDPQGNAYILYSVYTDEQGGDTVIGKVNSDGTTAWSIYWNNEIADDADWPVAMDVHSSGNVYILIKSDFNPNDMTSFWRSVIHKYDPDGNLLWQVNSPTYDHNPRDIDTDNAGIAYVLSDGMFRKYASADGEFLGYADVEYWWDDDGLPTNPEFWAPVVGVDPTFAVRH